MESATPSQQQPQIIVDNPPTVATPPREVALPPPKATARTRAGIVQPFAAVPAPVSFDEEPISTPEHQILYFLHIHKSAGTTMCEAARMRIIYVFTSDNCKVEVDQRCCGENDSLASTSK